MPSPQVTILVPNYKTLELTKLCLRLIRKLTPKDLYKVIVIDNHSQDESTQYLRSLKWIKLIEREPVEGEKVFQAHSRALDMALEQVDTPYALSIHTDTLVRDGRWLEYLLNQISANHNIAGVGSWKLESKSWWRCALKKLEARAQKIFSLGRKKLLCDNEHYLRSHCALYRMDLIKKFNLNFSLNDETAGLALHQELIRLGFDMLFLSSENLGKYVDHINHATMILHPELGTRKKTLKHGEAKIQQRLKAVNAEKILADDGLDI